jgi:uncharacterized repeat protein (TIGR01451 family)
VRRCGLYTAVFVLAVCLPHAGAAPPDAPPAAGPGSRAVIATSAPAVSPPAQAPAAAPTETSLPAPGPRVIIASSAPQAPQPVVPVPDDGLRLLRPGTAPQPGAPPSPAAPSGVELTAFRPAPATPDPPPPTPSGPQLPAPAPPEVRGAGQTVSLYLEKIGPAAHAVGQPFSYEIVVRNPGPTPAAGVRVEDNLPDHARPLKSEPPARVTGTRLEWDLGGLEPGAERRLKVTVQASREGTLDDRATATCSVSHSLGTRIHRPQLALTMTGPAQAKVGEAAVFRLQVTNNGTGPAAHVVVHDRLPAGLKHPHGEQVEAEVGTLGPGESKTLNLRPTAVAGGRHVNEATATADGGLEATANATVVVDAPALALRKTGPREAALYGQVEHRLEVVNTGTLAATNVRVTDTLPEGLDYRSASDGGVYAPAGRTVDWALGSLGPGQSRAVSVTVQARKAGDWANQALVRADWGLEAKGSAPVHVEGAPALGLKVVNPDNPVEIGAETTYEIRVHNQGAGACSKVKVEAVVPDGMAVVGAEPAAHRVQGQRVVFDPVASLAGGADTLFRVKVRAKTAGDWRFKAYLSCDPLQRPVSQEESTMVYDGGDQGAPAPPAPAARPPGAGASGPPNVSEGISRSQ